MFRSAIHEQPHLTDVEKLTYLFSCLKGEARRVVEGFTIEDNNYQLVIDTLNCVYGNKQALSRHLHRQLRQLHCQSHSASDLLRYHTDVDRILKHMANADISYENAHVLFDIEEGLPEETRLIIHQEQKKYPVWTTTLLRKTILDTSQMLQSVKIPQSSSSGNQVLHSKFPSNKKSSAMISLTARAPQNASQRGNLNTDPSKHSAVNQRRITSNPKSPCCFCGELHWNIACNKYKTVDQRRHRASTLKICFKCLTPGHVVAECPKKPCYICKGNHNQALCYQSQRKTFTNVTITNSAEKSPRTRNIANSVQHHTQEDSQSEDSSSNSIVATSTTLRSPTSDNEGTTALLLWKYTRVFNTLMPQSLRTAKVFLD